MRRGRQGIEGNGNLVETEGEKGRGEQPEGERFDSFHHGQYAISYEELPLARSPV